MPGSPGQPALYLLAGGASLRMGAPKARVFFGGQPLILATASGLLAHTGAVATAVAAPGASFADLGLRTIHDPVAHAGPAHGLLTALRDARALGLDWLLIAPCDQPGLSGSHVHALRGAAAHGGATAAAFELDGRIDPLPMLLSVRVLDELEAAVATGEQSLWRLLTRLRAARTPWPGGQPVPSRNRPADLLDPR